MLHERVFMEDIYIKVNNKNVGKCDLINKMKVSLYFRLIKKYDLYDIYLLVDSYFLRLSKLVEMCL